MVILGPNWLMEGILDYEYKKYMVLAYISQIQKNFNSNHLFPDLDCLFERYKESVLFQENMKAIWQRTKQIKGFNIATSELIYDEGYKDDLSIEIDKILNFAIPQFKNTSDHGMEIMKELDEHVVVEIVGVRPTSSFEGYIILKNGDENQVYKYEKVNSYLNIGEQWEIKTTPFGVWKKRRVDDIKEEIINKDKKLTMFYYVYSDFYLPIESTMLPIAKNKILKVFI